MTVHLSTLCLQSLIFPDACPRVNFSEEVALILKLTFNDTHLSKGWILNILVFWCHLDKFMKGRRPQDLKKKNQTQPEPNTTILWLYASLSLTHHKAEAPCVKTS